MASDNCDPTGEIPTQEETSAEKEDHISISLHFDNELAIRSCFYSLSEGGHCVEPLITPPWGGLFGRFVDKFGMPWMVSYRPKLTE
jgi:PhnB protein